MELFFVIIFQSSCKDTIFYVPKNAALKDVYILICIPSFEWRENVEKK